MPPAKEGYGHAEPLRHGRKAPPVNGRGTGGKDKAALRGRPRAAVPGPIAVDPWRAILFPNGIREQRRRRGLESLLMLAERLPDIPYIRLSKIERGEVFAKTAELRMIASAIPLDDPAALLIDVEAPDFSIAAWAMARGELPAANNDGEELAMLLAAACRARRAGDPELTLARLQGDYGLPAVIVSRIENAVKPLDRWNAATLASVCVLLGVNGRSALAVHLRALHEAGTLDPWLSRIPGAREREMRTRERIRALRAELALPPPAAEAGPAFVPAVPGRKERLLPILGAPGGDGLIDPVPGPQQVPPPPGAGPGAFALRMCRASLGPLIPGHAVLIVDPARTPVQGGLAVLREEKGLRVLAVTTDREGRLYGTSSNPVKEIALDPVPAADLAMVTAVLFG